MIGKGREFLMLLIIYKVTLLCDVLMKVQQTQHQRDFIHVFRDLNCLSKIKFVYYKYFQIINPLCILLCILMITFGAPSQLPYEFFVLCAYYKYPVNHCQDYTVDTVRIKRWE